MRNAARMRGRRTTGKSCHRQIETAPEKMDRAAFAAEPRAKFFEHPIGLKQNAPEPVRVFRIVGAMFLVTIERDRIRNFIRRDVDLDGDTDVAERTHHRSVKIGNTLRLEVNHALPAVAFQNEEIVLDEIEINLESIPAMRDGRSGQSARSKIKRYVPGMVRPWRESEPNLSDNLCPHVESGASVFPLRVTQLRPNF